MHNTITILTTKNYREKHNTINYGINSYIYNKEFREKHNTSNYGINSYILQ